jgi:transcriptional regulator with XRE-family HTH domain
VTRVKQLRESLNLEQKQLAIDLGVSQPTISDWENGRKIPSAKSTEKLADYFNVTIDYLLGRTDTPTAPDAEKDTSHEVSDEDIKFALFDGDGEITDEMFEEVKAFAQFVKAKRAKKDDDNKPI